MKKLGVLLGLVLILWALKVMWASADHEAESQTEDLFENSQTQTQSISVPAVSELSPPVAPSPSLTPLPTSLPVQEAVAELSQDPLPAVVKTPNSKTPEQLSQEKLKIPIAEELKNAVQLSRWTKDELSFNRIYLGQLNIQGKPYKVRMNLIFDGGNDDVSRRTCIAMYGPQKAVFKENYGGGNIKIYRKTEKDYAIVSVLNRFYFQLIGKRTNANREIITHLTVPGEKQPFVFNLKEFDIEGLDDCTTL